MGIDTIMQYCLNLQLRYIGGMGNLPIHPLLTPGGRVSHPPSSSSTLKVVPPATPPLPHPLYACIYYVEEKV
jgi:hypothetical protein